jgi:alpha-glucosidase
VPPRWAEGPTLYRGVHIANESVESYRDKVSADVANIAKYHLAVEAYDYEGWHGLDPKFVRTTNDRLRAMGIHPLAYLRAFVGNDGGLFDNQQDVDEAVGNGYVAKNSLGQPYAYQEAANQSYVIDFTNPAAVRWWERRVDAMLDLGFDGFMQDFGEQTQADMRFADGETGETMHNRYPNVYHRVTREIVDRWMAAHPGRRVFFFTRAGFSGRQGSAAFENTNFPGDETTDYQRSSGLPSLIPDMLNRGIGGAYGYNTDIGGYLDSYADQQLDLDLFERWTEASALMPFFRVHNSCCTKGTQMPWDFGAPGLDVWRKMAALHVRARPYLRQLWTRAQRTGLPVARPLWLEFPGDARAATQDEEFMLGSDVLVAPVMAKAAKRRDVYFPAGCWRSPETGRETTGGRTVAVGASPESLPYFFRCGSDPFAAAAAHKSVPKKARCLRKRKSRFRIHQPRHGRIVTVTAYIDGHRVRRLHRHRVTRLVLRKLPRRRFALRIVARHASGRRTISIRTYRRCKKGRPHTIVRPR